MKKTYRDNLKANKGKKQKQMTNERTQENHAMALNIK